MIKKMLVGILILVSTQSIAQKSWQWSLRGYVRSMQTISFAHPDSMWMNDNLIHNRLQLKATWHDSLNFEADIRNRLFYGETVSNMPGYALSADVDTGLVDASFLVASGRSYFLISQLDRVFIDYRFRKWNFTVGRQRINWAQTFVWNPNDIFNTYSFFDFDYDEKPGSDAIRIQHYTSNTSRVEFAAKTDSAHRLTAAALWMFNRKGFDIQLLGGIYKSNDIVAGLGFSGNLFAGTLRGEMSWFAPTKNFGDTGNIAIVSVGYDYMFGKGIFLQTELLYNPQGVASGRFNINDFYNLHISPKNMSVSRWSAFGMMSASINPLIKTNLSAMYYTGIHSMFVGPGITMSVSQNTDLMLMAYHFREFSPANGSNRYTMLFGRLGWSF